MDLSLAASAAKAMTVTALTGAAATTAATTAIPDPGIFSVLVMGIPLGVLVAALGGSSAQYLNKPRQPDSTVPREVRGTVIDGFIGGWLAMGLIGFTLTAPYLLMIEPAVVGALCALLVQTIRVHGKGYFDRIFTAALGWFSRNRVGGGS